MPSFPPLAELAELPEFADRSLFRIFQSGVSVSGLKPDNHYTQGVPHPRVGITTKTRIVRSCIALPIVKALSHI